ncbi:MAG: hypothetical protein ACRD8W_06165 [Nitrososphaeraceae archaeon]
MSYDEHDTPMDSSRLRGLSCHHAKMYHPRKKSPRIKQEFVQNYAASLTIYYEREHESSF